MCTATTGRTELTSTPTIERLQEWAVTTRHPGATAHTVITPPGRAAPRVLIRRRARDTGERNAVVQLENRSSGSIRARQLVSDPGVVQDTW